MESNIKELVKQTRCAHRALNLIGKLSHASQVYDDLLDWIINVQEIIRSNK